MPAGMEDDLLDGLRAGDERSYEELVRRNGGRMLSVAIRITGNPDDARDAVQDAFLQAFKNVSKFEERSSLATWLHRIVVNAALMKLRTRRRKPETSLDELMPRFDDVGCRIELRAGDDEPVDELLARRETRERVRDAIRDLPGDYRDVLILRDIEGLDTNEAADSLSIKPGAVKTRLHRARAALKTRLEIVIKGSPS